MSINLINRARRLMELPPDDSHQRVWKHDMLKVRQETKPDGGESFYICDEFTEEWILFESDSFRISISSPRVNDSYGHNGVDHCYAYISPKDHIEHYHDVFSHYYGSVMTIIPDHIVDRFHEIIRGAIVCEYPSPHSFCDEAVPESLLAPSQALMEDVRALDESEMEVVDPIEIRRAIRGFFKWHDMFDVGGVKTMTWMNDRYVISSSEVQTYNESLIFIAFDRSSEEYVVIVFDNSPEIITKDFSWFSEHGMGNPYPSTFAETTKYYHDLFSNCCINGGPYSDSEDDD